MNKKLFIAAVATTAAIFTSCSSDEVTPAIPGGNEGTVTFSVQVPGGVQSRAFADGTTAQNNLKYYVYDQSNGENASPVLEGTVAMSQLKGTLTLNLATAHTYDIIFLATASGAPYTYDAGARTMNVDYTNVLTSDENLDAFYASVKDLTVSGPTSQEVKLHRPFSQLNIGTKDKAEYEAITHTSLSTTSVSVTGLYSAFDLMNEDVTGATTDVTFQAAPLPGSGETFPVSYTNSAGSEIPYAYLSMDYLLVNQQKDLVEVSITIDNADGSREVREFSNIPVQRNFRTNIFGALLTSATDFNIEIVPGFQTPDYDYFYAPEVSTPAELLNAIEQFGGATIPEGVSIDTDDLLDSENSVITFDKPTTLVVNGEFTNTSGGQFHITDEFTLQGSGVIESSVRGLFWLEEGAKANVSDVTINTPAHNRGAGFWITGGELNADGVTFNSGAGTINTQPGSNAKVNLKNCTVNNSSSNIHGAGWSYALNFNSGTIVIENNVVNGIQGCIAAANDAQVTINGGTYATQNTEGKNDAFGTVYVTQDAVVTINGGSFFSPRKNYAAICGDNDVNTPYGTIILRGGLFSDKAWDSNTGRQCVIEPAEGFEYVATGDETHPWAVKPI